MSFYPGLAKTAQKLLTAYGQPMTLTVPATGAYDPATGAAAITPATYSCVGAIFDIDGNEINAPMVQAGDRRAFIAAASLAVQPLAGMSLTVGGAVWQVVSVKSIDPAGLAVMHELQVRK